MVYTSVDYHSKGFSLLVCHLLAKMSYLFFIFLPNLFIPLCSPCHCQLWVGCSRQYYVSFPASRFFSVDSEEFHREGAEHVEEQAILPSSAPSQHVGVVAKRTAYRTVKHVQLCSLEESNPSLHGGGQ